MLETYFSIFISYLLTVESFWLVDSVYLLLLPFDDDG